MNSRVRTVIAGVVVVASITLGLGAFRTTDARFVDVAGSSARVEAGVVDIEAGSTTPARLVGVDLRPTEQVARCYVLRYVGSIADVDVELFAEVTGGSGLAEHIELSVDRGTGAADGTCAGFRAEAEVLRAPLSALDPARAPRRVLWTAEEPGDEVAMRVTATVADTDDVTGKAVDFRLLWSAAP